MLNNIIIYNHDSEVKKISPIIKLLNFIIYTIQLFVFKDITSQILLYLELIFYIYLSHIPLKLMIKRVLIYIPILFLIILFPNSYSLIIKIFLITIFITIIDLTTNIKELVNGFQKLLSPLSFIINTKKISVLLTMIIKYPTTFCNNINIIYKETKANSIRNKTIIFNIIKLSLNKSSQDIRDMKESNKIKLYLKTKSSIKTNLSDLDLYLLIIHIIITLLLVLKGKT